MQLDHSTGVSDDLLVAHGHLPDAVSGAVHPNDVAAPKCEASSQQAARHPGWQLPIHDSAAGTLHLSSDCSSMEDELCQWLRVHARVSDRILRRTAERLNEADVFEVNDLSVLRRTTAGLDSVLSATTALKIADALDAMTLSGSAPDPSAPPPLVAAAAAAALPQPPVPAAHDPPPVPSQPPSSGLGQADERARIGQPSPRTATASPTAPLPSAAPDPPPVPTQPPSSDHCQTDERVCIDQLSPPAAAPASTTVLTAPLPSAAHDPPPVPTQPPSSGHGQTDERACISQPSESSAPSNPPAGRRNRRTRRQRSQQSSPPAGLTTAGTPWNVFIDAFIADWGMFIHLNPDLDDLLAKAEQVSCIPATIDGLASRLASPAEVTGELELELKNLGLPADKWVESVFQSARCGGYAFRRALIAALKRDTAPEQRSTVTAFVDSYCMAPVGDGRYTAGTRSFDAESRYYYIMYLTALRCRVCGAPSDHDDDDDDDGDDAWGRSVCGDYDVTAADDTTFEAFADFDD